MSTEFQAFRDRLLVPATSPKAFDWQAVSITALFSIIVHIFGSQDISYVSVPERVVSAGLSVIPMFLIIWLVHQIRTRSNSLRVWLILGSYIVGGAVRGAALSALLSFNGIITDASWSARITSSIISMGFTVAIVTYVWSTFKTHSDAINELVVETEQLSSALAQIELEANAQSLKHMSDISSEIIHELERIELSPGGEQVQEIQRVIDEQVRPLSKEFALDVASWVPANVKIPSPKFFKTWTSLDPVANLPSPWFAAGISLAPLPTAYAVFGQASAITLSLYIFIALLPSIFIGFKIARRIIPKLSSPWRELAFTGIMELIALPAVLATYLALIHTDNPSAYMVAGLITFPIYAWILAFGGALFEDLKHKRLALLDVKAQLNWAIARVNLLAWYNRGIVSRLLHGPIQNAMHATLIRLRNRDTLTVVDNVIKELQQRISSANENPDSGLGSFADLDSSFDDIRTLWNQIAEVSISCPSQVKDTLLLDKPAAAIVIDLCSEICSNAIRHGKATSVTIALEEKSPLITVKVTDNGSKPTEGNSNGLGRRFLDSCSISWNSSRVGNKNMLTVLLPGSAT